MHKIEESRVWLIFTGSEHKPHAASVRKPRISRDELHVWAEFYATGRETLRRLGLEPMEGSGNARGEYWITEAGYPYLVPYGTKPRETFVEQAFDEIIDKLIDKLG